MKLVPLWRYRDADAYPMLLVTHACPVTGIVQALTDHERSADFPPIYDRERIPAMGAVTVLEEHLAYPADEEEDDWGLPASKEAGGPGADEPAKAEGSPIRKSN